MTFIFTAPLRHTVVAQNLDAAIHAYEEECTRIGVGSPEIDYIMTCTVNGETHELFI